MIKIETTQETVVKEHWFCDVCGKEYSMGCSKRKCTICGCDVCNSCSEHEEHVEYEYSDRYCLKCWKMGEKYRSRIAKARAKFYALCDDAMKRWKDDSLEAAKKRFEEACANDKE